MAVMSEWTIGRVFRWGTTGVGVFAVGVAGLGVGLGVTQPDYRTVSGVRALPLPTVTLGDPLVTPGQWLVGEDIAAGDYVAEVVSSAGGYWARCADLQCSLDDGLVANLFLPPLTTPSVLTIAPSDVSVQLSGLKLTPR